MDCYIPPGKCQYSELASLSQKEIEKLQCVEYSRMDPNGNLKEDDNKGAYYLYSVYLPGRGSKEATLSHAVCTVVNLKTWSYRVLKSHLEMSKLDYVICISHRNTLRDTNQALEKRKSLDEWLHGQKALRANSIPLFLQITI